MFGSSDRSWLGKRRPLDLGPIGAPGCLLLMSPEITLPQQLDAGGGADFELFLPGDPALMGRRVFHQSAVLDAPANAFGIALTNGVRVDIGG